MASKTVTENKAPTFGTSADPRVDFFFHIIEDAQKDKTLKLVKKSWKCHSLDTLKLMAHMRDCRNGKGIRRQYHMCLVWLFNNQFPTLMANLKELVSFGYWKDLLHLLMILLFDGHIPEYMAKDDGYKSSDRSVKRGTEQKKKFLFPTYDRLVLRSLRKERQKRKKEMKAAIKKTKTDSEDIEMKDVTKESVNDVVMQTVANRAQALQESRKIFAQKKYESNVKYRELYDKIVDLFANQLKIDLEKMAKDIKSISLAGKWAPTNAHHFDKYLSISLPIGKRLCQLTNKLELKDKPKDISEFYQKEVCAPIRKYLKIPEVFMASNQWSDIDYSRVASKCMQKNKSVFIKYDKQRFEEYLKSKETIAGAVLKPVELVNRGDKFLFEVYKQEITEEEKLERMVIEKQWLSICENIKKKGGGLFDNAIAVCDVSGSMNGTPMSAAIGLTLLVMYLSAEPWNSLCITFAEKPQIHFVDKKLSFIQKLRSLHNMQWGGTTNFNSVFNLILNKAVEQRLKNNQLPKVLIVFTDMEFNQAFPNTKMTNYEMAKKQFEKRGYKLPPIIFWNLRSDKTSMSTPVQMNEMGTALLSGYSGQLLSLILKADDLENITPYSMMRSAIDNKRYDNLYVVYEKENL
ncbi:uncharacterized protein LOC128959988 [Oppia nitens]|uniref:uncharacterized protein LOC128959988 n=1 Tax=Oppia nitens TaxID=1686743 RepID=UPI0023DAD76C|nr:uncharacterized protein LOC128959988 [Oppia nitens]